MSKISRSDTEPKRLEEPMLNDTIYHDYYDMHLYDSNALLYDPFTLSVLHLISFYQASTIALGWYHDYSCYLGCSVPNFSYVCIATVSKRFSDFPPSKLGRLLCAQCSAFSFYTLMVNDDDDEPQKRKDYEDWLHGHMTVYCLRRYE
jgi:hypothetical protein